MRLVLLALPLGCPDPSGDYPKETWHEDMAEVRCATLDRCGWLDDLGFDDAEACRAGSIVDRPWRCAGHYDAGFAQACVAAWESSGCRDLLSGEADISACERTCDDE